VVVNLAGRRIVNEKRNYHDRTRAMYAFDANEARYPNLINVMVYDERVAEMHAGVYPLPEFHGAEDYVVSAAGVDALASALTERLARFAGATGGARLAPDFPAVLAATLARFNEFADRGVDADFGRGAYRYDLSWARANPGRPSAQHRANDRPNPTMYPIDSRRLHAILLAPGVLDTTGGPLTDAHARVLDLQRRPIPSLYGAGNCVASAAGDSYWGAGATLGNALTFGFLAGEHAASQALAATA
jgi:predicted oxidoreductase